jgi:hypothetical protein
VGGRHPVAPHRLARVGGGDVTGGGWERVGRARVGGGGCDGGGDGRGWDGGGRWDEAGKGDFFALAIFQL